MSRTFYYEDMARKFKEELKANPEVSEIIWRNESDYSCVKIVISWK